VENLPLVSATPVENLLLVSTTMAVNFPTSTTGVVDTYGQFAEAGGPQIANPQICGLTKFVTFLRTFCKCGNLQIWDLRTLYFCDLRTQILLWT
jgi:hypothetical protein